jgi:hypothetical protein
MGLLYWQGLNLSKLIGGRKGVFVVRPVGGCAIVEVESSSEGGCATVKGFGELADSRVIGSDGWAKIEG